MPYIYNTPDDQQAMLGAIGIDSLDKLFETIPAEYRLGRPLDLPPALGELELTAHMEALAAANGSPRNQVCFLGGGSYDHFIPAVVDYVASRGEFYTSYTPYQPEVAQGNLQAMFEYQTLICQLTGMEVSNQSLYDGGTAATEAVLMAMSVSGRMQKVVVAENVHPEYRDTLRTYLDHLGTELVTLPTPHGIIDPADLAAAVDDKTACVLLSQPNFFGALEDAETLVKIAHEAGALAIVHFDPISLGLLARPGDYGADIAVAEGQSLGTPMQFGGPYLGIMACREKFVRRLPGRIAGQTIDRRGRRCFVLTLQTREQHIRREKATSNICTNQGLFALRAAVYLATMGPRGLAAAAELSAQKAAYAKSRLLQTGRLEPVFAAPLFKEFVLRDREGCPEQLVEEGLAHGYFVGVPLQRWYPELADCLLICVTEKRTRAEIDGLARMVAETPAASRFGKVVHHA